jgi:hypothetical protein
MPFSSSYSQSFAFLPMPSVKLLPISRQEKRVIARRHDEAICKTSSNAFFVKLLPIFCISSNALRQAIPNLPPSKTCHCEEARRSNLLHFFQCLFRQATPNLLHFFQCPSPSYSQSVAFLPMPFAKLFPICCIFSNALSQS